MLLLDFRLYATPSGCWACSTLDFFLLLPQTFPSTTLSFLQTVLSDRATRLRMTPCEKILYSLRTFRLVC